MVEKCISGNRGAERVLEEQAAIKTLLTPESAARLALLRGLEAELHLVNGRPVAVIYERGMPHAVTVADGYAAGHRDCLEAVLRRIPELARRRSRSPRRVATA